MRLNLYPTKENDRINRYILTIVDQSEVKRNQQILRDALRLNQILINLLSNEVKYTGENGEAMTLYFLIGKCPKWTALKQHAGASAFIAIHMFRPTIYNTLQHVMKRGITMLPTETSPPDLNGKRFLLVEDNTFKLQIAQELLETVGAEVETALDGEKAVNCFMQPPPGYYDAVLMDIQMLVMDGYAAARAEPRVYPCR